MPGVFRQQHENIVLFMTHIWDEACTGAVNKLRTELGSQYDIMVLGYIPEGEVPAVPDDVPAIFYRDMDFTISPEFSAAARAASSKFGSAIFS